MTDVVLVTPQAQVVIVSENVIEVLTLGIQGPVGPPGPAGGGGPVITVSADFNITSAHAVYLVDTTGGPVVGTLPPASTHPYASFTVQRLDRANGLRVVPGTDPVTMDPDTINVVYTGSVLRNTNTVAIYTSDAISNYNVST